MTRLLMTLLLIIACIVLAPCCDTSPGTPAADIEREPFDCEIVVASLDGDLVPVGEGATVELQLGFQGFLFVELFVRSSFEGLPDEVDVAHSIAVGADDPWGSWRDEIDFPVDGDGVHLSEAVLIFFDNANVGDWVGRDATVTIKATTHTHECIASGPVQLVDDDPCIHTGEEPICPGDEGHDEVGQ